MKVVKRCTALEDAKEDDSILLNAAIFMNVYRLIYVSAK
jgi:hypothetical protein